MPQSPVSCSPPPTRGWWSARQRRPGPLTFRQSWGCVSTLGYCTCGGLGSGPRHPRPPPSPPGGTHPAVCRPAGVLQGVAEGPRPRAPAQTHVATHGTGRLPAQGLVPRVVVDSVPKGLCLCRDPPPGLESAEPPPTCVWSPAEPRTGNPPPPLGESLSEDLLLPHERGQGVRPCVLGAHVLAHTRVYAQILPPERACLGYAFVHGPATAGAREDQACPHAPSPLWPPAG